MNNIISNQLIIELLPSEFSGFILQIPNSGLGGDNLKA